MRAKNNIVVAFLAMIAASWIPLVHAQSVPSNTPKNDAIKNQVEPLKISLVRSKVVVIDGKEVLQSAEVAKPGDTLEDVATYTNISKSALKRVEATLPIPPNTELVVTSVKPAGAKASVDGVSFSSMPLKRKIKQSNGVEVEQNIPLSEYKYLRWPAGDLAAEKSMLVSARFKLSADSGIAAAKPN
jgi:hypothetical protein